MNKKGNGTVKTTLYYVLILLAMVMVVYYFFGNGSDRSPEIEYSTFTEQLKNGEVESFTVQPSNGVYRITGQYKDAQKVDNDSGLSVFGTTSSTSTSFSTIVLPNDSTLNEITTLASDQGVKTEIEQESNSGIWLSLLVSFLPLVIIIFFFYIWYC